MSYHATTTPQKWISHLILALTSLLTHAQSHAQKPDIAPTLDSLQYQQNYQDYNQQSPAINTPFPTKANDNNIYPIEAEELLKQPQLLQQAMNSVIRQQHMAGIEKILPIYRQWQEHDATLAAYAAGLLALHQQRFNQASNELSKVLQQQPNLQPARLYRSIALVADQQNLEAQKDLQQLKQEINDPDILATINNYQDILQQRQQWQWHGSFNIIKDSNINQAPDQTEWNNLRFYQKIADTGIHYQLGIAKKIFLPKGFYLNPQANLWGKSYRQHHDYNDLVAQTSLTLGLARSRYHLSLTPYFNKRFYGDHAYSNTTGIRLNALRHLNPRFSLAFSANHHQEHMQQEARKIYNNKNNQLGSNIIIRPLDSLTIITGIHFGKRYGTRDLDDSYRYTRYQFSTEQQFPNSFGIRLNALWDNKRYQAPNLFTANHNRHDKESLLEIALWHRQFQFKNLMPKLVWQRQQVRSNSPFNQYQKQGMYIEIEKVF